MQARRLLLIALLGLAGAAAAGCLGDADDDETQESAEDTDRGRVVIADLPGGTTEVEVDVRATDRAVNETTRVLVVVENSTRHVLTQDTFEVEGDTSRLLRVDPNGTARVYVTVRVVQGDADLQVEVRAVQPGEAPIVIVQERIEVREDDDDEDHRDGASPTPTPTAPTPTTPTPTTPTPPVNGTNETDEPTDNASA